MTKEEGGLMPRQWVSAETQVGLKESVQQKLLE